MTHDSSEPGVSSSNGMAKAMLLHNRQSQPSEKTHRHESSPGLNSPSRRAAPAILQERGLRQFHEGAHIFLNGLPPAASDRERYNRVEHIRKYKPAALFDESYGGEHFSPDKVTLSGMLDYTDDGVMMTSLHNETITIAVTDKWLFLARHTAQGFSQPMPPATRPLFKEDVVDILRGAPGDDGLYSAGPSLLEDGARRQDISTASTYFITVGRNEAPTRARFPNQINTLEHLMVQTNMRGEGTTIVYKSDASHSYNKTASLSVEFSANSRHLRILLVKDGDSEEAFKIFDDRV